MAEDVRLLHLWARQVRGLSIPIRREAESLGVAMAAGMIAYEMTRGGVLLG